MGVIIVNSRTRPCGGLSNVGLAFRPCFVILSVRGFSERGMKIAADAPRQVTHIAAIYGAFTVEYESYSIIIIFSRVQLNR
jgi:hypothetical protein